MLQSRPGEQGMVYCANTIAGNHDQLTAHFHHQISHRKPLSQRHQQTANPLDEKTVAAVGHALNSPQDLWQTNDALVLSRRHQRGDGLGKKELSDLVKREFTVLDCMQEFRIRSAAGTEGLDCQRVAAALPQVLKQQSGQQGLADAGVAASDKDDARQTRSVHAGELAQPHAE